MTIITPKETNWNARSAHLRSLVHEKKKVQDSLAHSKLLFNMIDAFYFTNITTAIVIRIVLDLQFVEILKSSCHPVYLYKCVFFFLSFFYFNIIFLQLFWTSSCTFLSVNQEAISSHFISQKEHFYIFVWKNLI